MDDIVARLRAWAADSVGCNPANAPCAEAAAAIERLRAERDKWRYLVGQSGEDVDAFEQQRAEIGRLRMTEAVLRAEITRLRKAGTGAADVIHRALAAHTEDALAAANVPLSKQDDEA